MKSSLLQPILLSSLLILTLLLGCGTENEPTFKLTTTVSPVGSGTILPSQTTFDKGETAVLEAVPNDDWRFVRWEGDLTSSVNPVNLGMTRDYNIIGVFESAGLVAYYPFNGNANDESGNQNHGIVLSAILASDRFGRANQAFYIDGLNCPTSKGIKLPVKLNDVRNYTISVWAKSFNPNKKHQTLLNSYPHAFIGLTFNYFGSYSSMFFGNGGWLTGGPPNDDISWQTEGSEWNSISVVKANNLLSVYQNGILVKSYSFNSANDFGAIGYFIAGAISIKGGVHCYETYHGSLDDIRIYNRALSTAEVAALYERERNPPPIP